MDPFSLLESWLIREAGFWILTRRKERDFGGSTWSARAEGRAPQWWAAATARLAQHVVLARVLQSPSALDCLIRTLSVFDGVVISIKNSSWRAAHAPTLIESYQSVVCLATSDACASRR